MHELLGTAHAEGLGALRQAAAESAANPAAALELTAAPALVTALRTDPLALAQFAARAGRSIALREDRLMPLSGWRLRPMPRSTA